MPGNWTGWSDNSRYRLDFGNWFVSISEFCYALLDVQYRLKTKDNELTRLIGEQRIATGEIAEQLARTVEEINNVSEVIKTTAENAR